MAAGALLALIGAWILIQGLNGNAGRLVTGQIGVANVSSASTGAGSPGLKLQPGTGGQ